MYDRTTIGTCSICGGAVTVPSVWMAVIPPVPTCSGCGATKAEGGPVIDMQPARPAPTQPVTRFATSTRWHF